MTLEHLHPVPHLTTAQTGPLLHLEAHFLAEQTRIEAWFRQQWQLTPAPFYASVDLRNAGFKLAPVDTNLFPAGFNNLNPAFQPLSIHAVQSAVERLCPTANKILLIPENHTRNIFYMESLAALTDTISKAGFEFRIGFMPENLDKDQQGVREIELPNGHSLTLEPLIRDGNKLGVQDFTPCLILLNNDLSAGQPTIFDNLEEQKVTPSPSLGWSQRLKSDHFSHYQTVANEFATVTDIDPWLINPMFLRCGKINFMKREGEQCLAENVTTLLKNIQYKYDEYKIDRKPFVIIKADDGTYGMGIMTAHSADDVASLNRKQRTKMSASKGGGTTSKVIIQEGVYTSETWGSEHAVTEPVVYMIDHFVVGGFYRVHTRRGSNENLNAPGMHFEPLAFVDTCSTPETDRAPDAQPNRFYAYGVIARLALLAAAREAQHSP